MSFSKKYNINYYNCDQNLELSIVSLIRFFEDIAIVHSNSVQLGFKFYNENKVAWYLTRWLVNVKDLPKFNETITVVTNPKSFYNFYANREYVVLNEKGDEIVSANTLWVFLDSETLKPKKIPENVFKGYGLNDDGRKFFSKLNEVILPNEFAACSNFRILQRDIDYNNHVNNSQYISYALETINPEFLKSHRITKLEVNYLKEAYLNDFISVHTSKTSPDDKELFHLISKSNAELCKIKSNWMLR